MKYVVVLVLALGGLVANAQSGINGDWKGTRETPNGTFEINYTFKVEGATLTGTWKTQFGEQPIENGKVEENKFSFSVSFGERTINYTGELISENEIVLKNERGEFKLARVEK
ncbi:MAG: hypothetical protein KIPDCIKN_03479 [Haliscomenobacter sp.]|jgi:hypothetical protein|nr:hypothetical protein [Haliscomenobacter sp.]